MFPTFPHCWMLRATLPLLVIVWLTGCDTGYKIDTRKNVVVWVTWDEGNGRREWPVNGADSKSFKVMTLDDQGQFGRDKDHVYFCAACVDGADPGSFREFGTGYRDDRSVFLRVDGKLRQLPNSHPDSFRRLDELFWSRDDTRVFFENRGFIPDDIASFELLNVRWTPKTGPLDLLQSELVR